VSFRVLVIPEDPTNDRYILTPLVERLMAECGKPRAKVQFLPNPRVRGYKHAKEVIRNEVFELYGHMDLVLFLPDADGKDRSEEFAALEGEARTHQICLLCCAAVQEVELWLLAGHQDKVPKAWSDLRDDVSVKEHFFDPFLDQFGEPRRPGGGRDVLMKTTLDNFAALLQRCPELAELKGRIEKILSEA
jgi:hypothetical protein